MNADFSVIKEQQNRFFKAEIDAIEMGPLEADVLDEEDELGDGYMYADGRLPTYSDARFSAASEDTPDVCVGDRVMALWKDGTQPGFPGYFPGVVVRINPRNLSYAILYDDGYMDRHVKRSAIRKAGDATASPESTRLGNRQESSLFPPPPPHLGDLVEKTFRSPLILEFPLATTIQKKHSGCRFFLKCFHHIICLLCINGLIMA